MTNIKQSNLLYSFSQCLQNENFKTLVSALYTDHLRRWMIYVSYVQEPQFLHLAGLPWLAECDCCKYCIH